MFENRGCQLSTCEARVKNFFPAEASGRRQRIILNDKFLFQEEERIKFETKIMDEPRTRNRATNFKNIFQGHM